MFKLAILELQNIFLWKRTFQTSIKMAKSKFEYVKSFETEDRLEPNHWIIIALKCSNMKKIVNVHALEQPNDKHLVQLMVNSAKCVMGDFKELQMCYTFRNEVNFVFPKNTTLYRRRGPKLLTNLCSLMSAAFVKSWPVHVKSMSLGFSPIFEGTTYLMPSDQELRDFVTQRQLMCHYENLNETVLWALVKTLSVSFDEAVSILKGTSEGEKNEILFSRCNQNYNKEDDVYKKGSIILRKSVPTEVITPDGSKKLRAQSMLVDMNTDFVKDSFWREVFPISEYTKSTNKTHYLKDLERNSKLLPHSWIMVRIDGKGFHKFSEKHNFAKPNDIRSIELMNRAAMTVMKEYSDIVLSYGQSDEYTFVINRYSRIMDRNSNRIMTSVVSLFSATYVYYWNEVFGVTTLQYAPAFDARVVLYPNNSCLRDCLSWRQADCHINNMYNLCFWMLVQKGNLSRREAEEKLCGTFSKDKRNILFGDFNIDYDKEEAIFRKGTIMYRDNANESATVSLLVESCAEKQSSSSITSTQDIDCIQTPSDSRIITAHIDMINDKFWLERPWLLGVERGARTLDDLDD